MCFALIYCLLLIDVSSPHLTSISCCACWAISQSARLAQTFAFGIAQSKSQELTNNFISGSIGGGVGTAINTPFDVVKSRIQSTSTPPGVVPKYNWTFPSIATVAREEGLGALYKGFAPKVLRLAPGGGVMLLVVEVVLTQFRNFLGPPYI